MQHTVESLYDTFAVQARRYPDRLCLADDKKQYTYSEVLIAIDTITSNLISQHVSAGDKVAIYSQKSANAILYFLALSRLGCYIITLDLAFPEAQCQYVLADAKVDCIVCETSFPHNTSIPIYDADSLFKPNNEHINIQKTQFSQWIVYSSGTTGNPKGIWISEQAMLHSFAKRETFSGYSSNDMVACSIYLYWEVFRPLINGAGVLILENQSILDFNIYSQLIEQYEVVETLWTPSFAELLVKTATDTQIRNLSSLQRVWLNGEVVSNHLNQLLHARLPNIRFFNLYSISETFDISAYELDVSQSFADETVPIGKPFPHTEVLLLRPDYSECAPKEQGELFIGGNSLAGGYLNQPEKQMQSFVTLPQFPSSPYWFKTKDIAYQSDDGGYHIIGRNDDIVKLRGYNISLLSIENMIKKSIAIRQCYVRLEDSGEGNDEHIVVYLQPENTDKFIREFDYDGDSCHSPVLYQILSQFLPHYAIPACYKIIDNVQYNAYSAKLVRKKNQPNEVDPLKALWQQCLNLNSQVITDDSDFFALGGTSLQAVQLVQSFNEQFTKTISIQTIFQNPRFQEFKAAINGATLSQSLNSLIFEDINWQPTSQSSNIRNCNLFNAKTIFMTGITGFLGVHWLYHLLKNTSAEIHCLVRCASEFEGLKRLEDSFQRFNLNNNFWQDRVTIIPGDLKLDRFGVSSNQWQKLSNEIDLVIHAAAQVNLMHGYENLRGSTIIGTQSILELATTNYLKPLFLISSDAVFSNDNLNQRASFLARDSINQLTYGYAQTKWVQEYLVKQISEQTKLPYIIARLGNIAPSLTTGMSNPGDANGMVLISIKGLKKQPRNLQLEFCPIDKLVKVLTDIGQASFDNQIISLNGINCVSSQLLKQLLPDWHIKDIDYKDWQQSLIKPFPELYGLTSIPQLFTRQYEVYQDLISQTPFAQQLQLSEDELRNSLLIMAK